MQHIEHEKKEGENWVIVNDVVRYPFSFNYRPGLVIYGNNLENTYATYTLPNTEGPTDAEDAR